MADAIALLTNKTFLMKKNAEGKWAKLIDITKYPQLGGETDRIEVTRLSDMKKRYINGLEESENLGFEANYTLADYTALSEIAASNSIETYRLCFGDELGTDGCFEWSGKLVVYINEGESNNARKMTFSISDEGNTALTEVDALTEDQLEAA